MGINKGVVKRKLCFISDCKKQVNKEQSKKVVITPKKYVIQNKTKMKNTKYSVLLNKLKFLRLIIKNMRISNANAYKYKDYGFKVRGYMFIKGGARNTQKNRGIKAKC